MNPAGSLTWRTCRTCLGPVQAGFARCYQCDLAAAARQRLREMLSAYLRDHAGGVWRAAGMADGPAVAAVVPSGQGRPGAHPLLGIVQSCVDLPLARLVVDPRRAARGRGVSLGWLRVHGPVTGADVLLVDDTWVSGGSAQSAAAALKLAGARRVALVVLGRQVDPADPRSAGLLRALRLRSVHDDAADDLPVV